MGRYRDDDPHRSTFSEDERRAWREEVSDVRPLPPSPRRVVARESASAGRTPRDETAADRPWVVEDDGQRHRGRAPDVSRDLPRRLAAGGFPVEARCDLHGMTRDEAAAALARFVADARGAGHRTLLVIHGRGTHTPEGRAVLRTFVLRWLRRAEVLAFASAPPRLGGAGATLVRLRRVRGR